MNSEELELSLRTEFESHLKDVFADMRQEVSQFQEKIEAEFEKHRSQIDEAFREFSTRINTARELDANFKDTVIEHLRLARDEGATITAKAFAEAEEMERQMAVSEQSSPLATVPAPSEVGLGFLRNATSEISRQTSQATVLQTLTDHAGRFAPRGAFFIVRNGQFVGWRGFGQESQTDDETVREISLSVDSDSILGEAIRSLSAVESSSETFGDDSNFLEPLGFGKPEKMYAIPLVARGRGVAVLYADSPAEGKNVNVEALETLLCVAGLTVEVLASSASVQRAEAYAPQPTEYAKEPVTEEAKAPEYQEQPVEDEVPVAEEPQVSEDSKEFETVSDYQTVDEYQTTDKEFAETDVQTSFEEESFSVPTDFETKAPGNDFAVDDSPIEEIDVEGKGFPEVIHIDEENITQDYKFDEDQAANLEQTPSTEVSEEVSEFDYSPEEPVQTPKFDASTLVTDEDFLPEKEEILPKRKKGKAEKVASAPAVETVSEAVSAKPARTRLSDRNVDLPIEVSEDERRLHNDARRFARLLVSEIKLYNEQKVKEGREASDLYDRLREAIDRSREMYDKRVQPPVAAKFDYFHYELVSGLADGEEKRLGGGYPGSAI